MGRESFGGGSVGGERGGRGAGEQSVYQGDLLLRGLGKVPLDLSVTSGNINLDTGGYSRVRIVAATGDFTIQAIQTMFMDGQDLEIINDTIYTMTIDNNAGTPPDGYTKAYTMTGEKVIFYRFGVANFAFIYTLVTAGTQWFMTGGNTLYSSVLSGNLGGGTVGASTTAYLSQNAIHTTILAADLTLPFACNVRNFYLRTGTAQPASGSLVLTVFKNGVSAGFGLTIPANEPAGRFFTSAKGGFAAGDEFCIEAVNNATAASAALRGWSVELEVS